jgi:hypothetical protein
VYFTWRHVHIYGNISLNSSQNQKYFRKHLQRKSKHILCSITFSRKSCHLWDSVKKMWKRVKGRKWQYGGRRLHAGQTRLHARTHTHTHTHRYVMFTAFTR